MKKEFKNLKEAFKLLEEVAEENAIISVEKKGKYVTTTVNSSNIMAIMLLIKLIVDLSINIELSSDIICEAVAYGLAQAEKERTSKDKEEENNDEEETECKCGISEKDIKKLEEIIKRIFG